MEFSIGHFSVQTAHEHFASQGLIATMGRFGIDTFALNDVHVLHVDLFQENDMRTRQGKKSRVTFSGEDGSSKSTKPYPFDRPDLSYFTVALSTVPKLEKYSRRCSRDMCHERQQPAIEPYPFSYPNRVHRRRLFSCYKTSRSIRAFPVRLTRCSLDRIVRSIVHARAVLSTLLHCRSVVGRILRRG